MRVFSAKTTAKVGWVEHLLVGAEFAEGAADALDLIAAQRHYVTHFNQFSVKVQDLLIRTSTTSFAFM